jgi:hypothetical protein
MTTTISEIEAAYLATVQGAKNAGLAPDSVDVPGLRRVVIQTGRVLVNGEPATPNEAYSILEALKARAGK